MKNNKKFILAAGAAALGLVAATGVTSGFAWFTAANTVEVNGLNMKAAAEEGIVIATTSKKTAKTWSTIVGADFTGGSEGFIPTSTADLSTWYHNVSSTSTTYEGAAGIETFTLSGNDNTEIEGINLGHTTKQVLSNKNIFLLNKFYILSAGAAATGQDIFVQDLTVSGSTSSPDLDKALRVGIKYANNDPKIFAPVYYDANVNNNPDVSYTVGGNNSASVNAITDTATSGVVLTGANGVNIPAYNAEGTGALEFKVYIWFEGEDPNCKSANITATLDTLRIEFKFGNKAHV